MAEVDTHDWDEFLKARNELEGANEYHISLLDKYSASTTRPGQPLSITSNAAKAELEAAEERLILARERMRLAEERLR